jgi:hypothetical protein
MPNCIRLCEGYPGHYPHNADCTWNIQAGFPDGIISKLAPDYSLILFPRKIFHVETRIQVALGRRIQFHFAALNIESHPNCSFDRVG